MRKLIVCRTGIVVLIIAAIAGRAGRAADTPGRPVVQPADDARKEPKAKEKPVPEPGMRVVAGPVEVERAYRLSLGPWSWQFSAPESIDLPDIVDRIRGLFGMLLILGVAAYLSDNRRAISRRVVLWGLGLQW
ncbi:MAG TPA: Na+ dependent nucleoside transporter N-terminal domain-containing protein, partial [Isosphaeraceae bacterium]|nr:Na+ dependent nucleoside transporter N-terminal domain-containing protein [Isosphaeraceae bacterium]